MYVRQNLQKQSVHLAYASVAYTVIKLFLKSSLLVMILLTFKADEPGNQFSINETNLSRNNTQINNEKPILVSFL
jgi:hypothetical protein